MRNVSSKKKVARHHPSSTCQELGQSVFGFQRFDEKNRILVALEGLELVVDILEDVVANSSALLHIVHFGRRQEWRAKSGFALHCGLEQTRIET